MIAFVKFETVPVGYKAGGYFYATRGIEVSGAKTEIRETASLADAMQFTKRANAYLCGVYDEQVFAAINAEAQARAESAA